MDIKEKIKGFPRAPGVYIMRGDDQKVLYVGKAIDLKKRVSSYFYPNRVHSARIGLMVGHVRDITFLPTASEAEALIYENGLIKELTPRYNIALRDDKSYPMLKLTVNEKFPRLFITRQKKDDGALYYGPYSDAGLLRKAVEALRELFPLRSCNAIGKKPCLNYHIKRCFAPCAGAIDEKVYNEMVEEARLFLTGRRSELLKRVSENMARASREERFEDAALLKSRLEALSGMRSKAVRYGPIDEVKELGCVIDLKAGPDTIEAFDISNIMGESAVGSMVVFYKGRPRKSQYRKFKIRSVSGIDDYAMIREVVHRRYAHLIEDKSKMPDLVLIDGGKGHLAVTVDELSGLGLSYIPVISIAKEFEHIFVKDRLDPVVLPKESKALHLVQRIRDEAHRFAITYYKSLSSKKIKASELDEVRGIGPKRKKALMSYFGSVERIRSAGMEKLLKVEGMNEKAARSIIEYFGR